MANFSGRDGSAFYGTTAATGTLTLTANAGNGQTVTIGGKVYTFQTTLTNADGNVLIGANASDSLDNLIAAINRGAGAGTLYAAATIVHATVTAAAGAGDTMVVTARVRGTGGNAIGTTETLANGSWANATLTGGADSAIGELRVWSLDLDVELTEDTVKGDTVRTYKPDIPAGRGTVECWLDYGDTAQAALIDDINAGNQPEVTAELFATGADPGPPAKKFAVSALAVNYRVNSPEGNARVSLTFGLTLTSIPAVTWT
jgi:hypothetical protein